MSSRRRACFFLVAITPLVLASTIPVRAQAIPPTQPSPPSSAPSGAKSSGDLASLPQFKEEIDFAPKGPNEKVQLSLEDADLPELIKVMGQLTGRRFIFGGKVRAIKASIYAPQKVTVAEAYQAFLSVLETNGLTVIPHGKFLKIIETPGVVTQGTEVIGTNSKSAPEDRYVTRLHRLSFVTADEVANVLGHFKSKDGDVTIYSPGNLLILTDTGANIERMLKLVEEIDVAGIGDQVWIEPIHYAGAQEIATKLGEVFDLGKGATSAASAGAATTKAPGSQAIDARVTKIIPEERSNSLVVIGTAKAYGRILELIKRLDVPLSGEGEIHVLPLQHADAEDLAKTLNDVTTKGGAPAPAAPSSAAKTAVFEGAIRVTADKSTNSLVITSSLRDYAAIRNVIDRLDQARRQVFIEAVIMEVNTKHDDILNVNFHGGAAEGGSDGVTVMGGSSPLKSIMFGTDSASLQGLALGVMSSQTLTALGMSIPAFGVALQALTKSGDSNVISTPHILATDNVPAEISVGENVPLQAGFPSIPGLGAATGATGATGASGFGALAGLGAFTTPVSRQDIGTKVKIVPHINDSDEVRLEIDEEISDRAASAGVDLNPTISKRSAKTQVIVQDQQTIVIGGLVRDVTIKQESKVPVLGDIPLIGALFKQSTKSIQKQNLLLILTPYVIRDPADLRAIFERKMQERAEFLDRYFVFSGKAGEYDRNVDYTRTYGLVEEIRKAYAKLDEKAALEEATKPKEPKTHEPSNPIGEPAIDTASSYKGKPSTSSPSGISTVAVGIVPSPMPPIGPSSIPAPKTVLAPASPTTAAVIEH